MANLNRRLKNRKRFRLEIDTQGGSATDTITLCINAGDYLCVEMRAYNSALLMRFTGFRMTMHVLVMKWPLSHHYCEQA